MLGDLRSPSLSRIVTAVAVAGVLPAIGLAGAPRFARTTTRVSVDATGGQGNRESGTQGISVSANADIVAFASNASNLVAGDLNNSWDVFVRNRRSDKTLLVSASLLGAAGNGSSAWPSISADGRLVTFQSSATDLVLAQTYGPQVFVRDLQSGVTICASVSSTGEAANQPSFYPKISADGRYVAFQSRASNLVAGDTNGVQDVFVHDLETGETERVSVSSAGGEGDKDSGFDSLSISEDGRFVAFPSFATNLVPGDTNRVHDIFVRDRSAGTTTLASVASDGVQGNAGSYFASISANGEAVAFTSMASNLVQGDTNGVYDVFVHDMATGETSRCSVSNSGSQGLLLSDYPDISGDGRFVSFASPASTLVAGDTNSTFDVFVHDRLIGTTWRVSLTSAGEQSNGSSTGSVISGDGRCVAFTSDATNLVAGDTNGVADVFVVGPPLLKLVGPHR